MKSNLVGCALHTKKLEHNVIKIRVICEICGFVFFA